LPGYAEENCLNDLRAHSALNQSEGELLMYKNILACVDGSASSKLALQHAIQLAKEHEAKLRLLCVVDWASTPDMHHEYDLHGFVTSETAETASEAGEGNLARGARARPTIRSASR
jgi:nucleotide-binding universal stress UspA family protein